jgi:D-alanyl-lipoteichoic acid acyltransferase DltB (MBOAT superfamily)
MLFHSPSFILGFLPVCLAGFFTLGQVAGATGALVWLTAASLVFYGWWNPAFLPLLIGSVLVNHAIAWKIRHSAVPQRWMAAGVALNLAVPGWFKYADFMLHIVVPAAPSLGITLPLAISFFTFQQIMVLVDTAQTTAASPVIARISSTAAILMSGGKDVGPVLWPGLSRQLTASGGGYSKVVDGRTKSGHDAIGTAGAGANTVHALLPYAAFVTFFPHLIAGPIVRSAEIIPQLTSPGFARPHGDNLAAGLLIFLLGLGKKCILADMFGSFADTGFGAAARGIDLTFFEAWYATLSYALQIYFDFSGYSDMAIGLARMLNVRFPLNFDSPYRAADISDFWRRWHITLGAFLRDYLYIPLGGSRVGRLRQAVNLMATMLLAGLWHGAGWNFVIWGGLHGLFLLIHREYRRLFPPLPALLARALTLTAVILAWVPFRATSLSETLIVFRGLFGLTGIALPQMIVSAFPPLAAVAAPVAVMPSLGDARTLSFPEVSACLLLGWFIVLALPNIHRMTEQSRHWALTASFALSVQTVFFAPHVAPFLYFQF